MSEFLTNTGAMCALFVHDESREDACRFVDMGNYFTDERGKQYLFTSRDLAEQFGHLIHPSITIVVGKDESA